MCCRVSNDIEDNLGLVSVILQWRTLDALTLILRNINSEEADAMVQTHEKGQFITGHPSINMEE